MRALAFRCGRSLWWTDNKFKFPSLWTDSRVAYAIEKESERNGSRHEQIQQHKSLGSEADTRVTGRHLRRRSAKLLKWKWGANFWNDFHKQQTSLKIHSRTLTDGGEPNVRFIRWTPSVLSALLYWCQQNIHRKTNFNKFPGISLLRHKETQLSKAPGDLW